jgi:hypothetical protein
MSTSAKKLYQTARTLPPAEQLRLAALILGELTRLGGFPTFEESDGWSEDDQKDAAAFSLGYAESAYPEEEELVG